jgi:hypothetical protein
MSAANSRLKSANFNEILMNLTFSGATWVARIKAGLAAGALLGAHGAYADPSVELTATINPGTACAANLGDTDLDYGEIKTSELSKTEPTALPPKPLTMTVACAPFASKFFFRVIDRAPNTARPPENLAPAAGLTLPIYPHGIGLGTTPNKRPLGELYLRSTAIVADAQAKIMVGSAGGDNGPVVTGWEKVPTDFFAGSATGTRRYAVAEPASEVLTAAKNFTIQMQAIPVISPSAIADLADDARIDSKFTIEVTQL